MKIFESPDTVRREPPLKISIPLKFGVPFGYYKDKMYIGKLGQTHYDLWVKMSKDEELISDEAWHESRQGINAREMFTYPGRIFSKFMILTLWEFPDEKGLKKLVKDLEHSHSFFKIEIQPFGKIDDPSVWYKNHQMDPQQINIKDYKVKNKVIQPYVMNEYKTPTFSEFLTETHTIITIP